MAAWAYTYNAIQKSNILSPFTVCPKHVIVYIYIRISIGTDSAFHFACPCRLSIVRTSNIWRIIYIKTGAIYDVLSIPARRPRVPHAHTYIYYICVKLYYNMPTPINNVFIESKRRVFICFQTFSCAIMPPFIAFELDLTILYHVRTLCVLRIAYFDRIRYINVWQISK